jgi:hypothetical protein
MLQHQTIQATIQEGVQRFLNIHPDKILKWMTNSKGASMVGQGGRSIRMLMNHDSDHWVAGNATEGIGRCNDNELRDKYVYNEVEANCVLGILKLL